MSNPYPLSPQPSGDRTEHLRYPMVDTPIEVSTSAEIAPPLERRSLNVFGIVTALLVILLVAYISFSDGLDYIHGFGKACLVIHDSWRFHIQCGAVSPPSP